MDTQTIEHRTKEQKLEALYSLMDYMNVVIKIDGTVVLHFPLGVRLTSDRDVIIMSGRDKNPKRPGYIHSVWENPDLNHLDQPIMKTHFLNIRTGEIELRQAHFNEAGKLRVPFGYMASEEFGVTTVKSGK